MIQFFIVVSILVFFGITLTYILDLRDSYRTEYLEIRKLRRRYASGALRDSASASGHPFRTCSPNGRMQPASRVSAKDYMNKTTITEFINVGDQCA